MLPKHTIAALVASAALIGGSALAAPDTPEAAQGAPFFIIELLPPDGSGGPGSTAPSEQEQAIMGMLLLQLLMGLQTEGEGSEVQPIAAPTRGQSI